MKHLVSYQCEVDKGKLPAVASFEKLTFRACALLRIMGYVCVYITYSLYVK